MYNNQERPEKSFVLSRQTAKTGEFVVSDEVVISGTHQDGGKSIGVSFHKDEVVTIVHEDEAGVVISAPRFMLNVLLKWEDLEESNLSLREQ